MGLPLFIIPRPFNKNLHRKLSLSCPSSAPTVDWSLSTITANDQASAIPCQRSKFKVFPSSAARRAVFDGRDVIRYTRQSEVWGSAVWPCSVCKQTHVVVRKVSKIGGNPDRTKPCHRGLGLETWRNGLATESMEVEPACIAENEMVSRQFVGDEVTTCSRDANCHGKWATRLRALDGLHHVVQRGRAYGMSVFPLLATRRSEIEKQRALFRRFDVRTCRIEGYQGVMVGVGNVTN